jgi:hypothetical protein
MRQALTRNGFIDYGEKRLLWAAENVPRLCEFVRLTAMAGAGTLYGTLGQSAATTSIIGRALEEWEAGDGQIEIGIDIC